MTKNHRFRPFWIVCCTLLPGCAGVGPAGNDNTDDGGSATLTAAQRRLVEQSVARTFDDAIYTTVMTHDAEQGFALSLVGVDQGWRGTAFLVQTCQEAATFDPYCDPGDEGEENDEFWQAHTRCSQLECESAGVTLTHMFFTQKPHTDRADRHAFRYDTIDPPGSAVYDPNPVITWRTQLGDGDILTTSAELRQDLVVTTEDGQVIDLAFSGRVNLRRTADVAISGTLDLGFDGLIEGEAAVQVTFEIDADENGAGDVKVGPRTLATLSLSPDSALVFTWVDAGEP